MEWWVLPWLPSVLRVAVGFWALAIAVRVVANRGISGTVHPGRDKAGRTSWSGALWLAQAGCLAVLIVAYPLNYLSGALDVPAPFWPTVGGVRVSNNESLLLAITVASLAMLVVDAVAADTSAHGRDVRDGLRMSWLSLATAILVLLATWIGPKGGP